MYKCRPVVAFGEEARTYECRPIVAFGEESLTYKCRPIVAFGEEALTYKCRPLVALWWRKGSYVRMATGSSLMMKRLFLCTNADYNYYGIYLLSWLKDVGSHNNFLCALALLITKLNKSARPGHCRQCKDCCLEQDGGTWPKPKACKTLRTDSQKI
jgi:hypothetical protein